MADEVVSISLEIEIANLKKAIVEATGETDKAAKKMVADVVKSYNKAEAAAKGSAKAAAKEYEKSLDAVKNSVEKAASLLGGPFAGVSDLVLDLGEKLTGTEAVLGGVGVAAGVGAAAVVGLGVAIVGGASAIDDFIASADPLIERLEHIGGAPPLPPDTIAALDDYRASSLAAEAATDRLEVRVAGLAAEAFEPAAATAAGFVAKLDDLLPSAAALGQEIEFLREASRVTAGVFTLGASEAIRYALGLDDLEAAGRDASASLEDLDAIQQQVNAHMSAAERFVAIQKDAILAATGASDAQQRLARETDAVDEAAQKLIDTLDLSTEAGRAQADAIFDSAEVRKAQIVAAYNEAEAEKAAAAAKREEAEATREATAAKREQEEEWKRFDKAVAETAETEKRTFALAAGAASEAAKAAKDAHKVQEDALKDSVESLHKALEQAKEDAKAQLAEVEGLAFDFADSLAGVFEDLAAQQVDSTQRELEERRDALDEWNAGQQEKIDRELETGQISEAEANEARKRLILETREKRRQLHQEATDRRAAAIQAWKDNQALQVSMVGLEFARAQIAIAAGFGAMGPVGLGLAEGALIADAAASLNAIQNAEPPQFSGGGLVADRMEGVPDHVMIGARPDDFVLTPRGVQEAGGVDAARELNAGHGRHGGTVFNLHLHRRLVASVRADEDDDAWMHARGPVGKRTPYGGR